MNSKIHFKITDKVEKEAFSSFVYENPNTSIFQTLEMAEVYKRNRGCKPLTLVIINEDTGDILATVLAKILEEKRGVLSSFSRHSTIRGGPIFVNNTEGTKAVSFLMGHYNEIIKKDVLYSRIYPLNDTPQLLPCFKENGYEYCGWKNFLLDLNKPIDEIWKSLKKSRRTGVNKARKKGVVIEEIKERTDIPIFYELLKETYKKRYTPLEDISNFEAAFDVLFPKNMAKFFMAKYNGEYLSALLVLLFNKKSYMWYLGSSQKREDLLLSPNDLIVWHAIEQGIQNGFYLFDFGGGGDPNDTSGWVEFKRQFGGELVNYGKYTNIYKPIKMWFAEKAFALYKKVL